jgi:hypothetical protein
MAERRQRTPKSAQGQTDARDGDGHDDSSERVERLKQGVGRMRIRGWSMDVPRMIMIGGGALLILGLVFIGMAWYGAAHTPYLFEQVPYLISGGLLGLGLTFVGGSFYFAYWMTRQVQETKRQSAATQEALGRIEEALREGGAPNGGGGSRTSSRASANGTSFVATAKGTMFHRPDCPVVAGRKDLKRVSADAKGLEPCRMCDPLGVSVS